MSGDRIPAEMLTRIGKVIYETGELFACRQPRRWEELDEIERARAEHQAWWAIKEYLA